MRAKLHAMKFRVLQDNLRKALWERIDQGDLTGLRLARQTGFKQAHISNFLNKKRGLSLEGMDKVLAVQHLSVLDLLDPAEVNRRASILPPSSDEFDNVLLADASVAATHPLITSTNVKEILKFKKSFLRKLVSTNAPLSAQPPSCWMERQSGLRTIRALTATVENALAIELGLNPGELLLDYPTKTQMLGLDIPVKRRDGSIRRLTAEGWEGSMNLPKLSEELYRSARWLRVFTKTRMTIDRSRVMALASMSADDVRSRVRAGQPIFS